jgi:hypothetical protein
MKYVNKLSHELIINIKNTRPERNRKTNAKELLGRFEQS